MDGVPGSKAGAGVWQWIISHMPEHRVYVEAFAGSAYVYRRKRRCELAVLIDRTPSMAAVMATAESADAAGHSVIVGDAISILPALRLGPDALVYADPPYPKSSRRSQRDLYQFEMTDVHHQHLCRCLRSLNCLVMVSTYANPIYARELGDWRVSTRSTTTRGGARSTELLYMNFPETDRLHDARFVGRDYRDRERIKRKAKRWASAIATMPAAERAAVREAIGWNRTSGLWQETETVDPGAF